VNQQGNVPEIEVRAKARLSSGSPDPADDRQCRALAAWQAAEKLSRGHSGTPRSGGPGIQNIGISCISGFRARAFGAPRNDAADFFNGLLGQLVQALPLVRQCAEFLV
jgi:hypothetical protein